MAKDEDKKHEEDNDDEGEGGEEEGLKLDKAKIRPKGKV